jgi:hypothetical protein
VAAHRRGAERDQGRLLGAAPRLRARAAIGERAAGRQRGQARHHARDLDQPGAGLVVRARGRRRGIGRHRQIRGERERGFDGTRRGVVGGAGRRLRVESADEVRERAPCGRGRGQGIEHRGGVLEAISLVDGEQPVDHGHLGWNDVRELGLQHGGGNDDGHGAVNC